ncbi:MAG: adenylosuccinate lyase, partial [Actinomycetia bacterium]|nr:adenylosuccinate lyase [Actinomycetes bacterium]
MIKRYTLKEMGNIWSEENKFSKWLEVEIAAMEAWSERGVVTKKEVEEFKEKASFDVGRIVEIEKEVEHDVIAFLTNVSENAGKSGRFLHYGLTSSDVVDTSLSILLRDAIDIIIRDTRILTTTLKEKAFQYRDLIMIGRTHGIHAEPTTFGFKLAVWTFEMARNLVRLIRARETISVGKISGAVGTYSQIDPLIENYVCERVGLQPAPASTQVLQRDRHAEYMSALAVLASSLEKFALEIRHLQKTEILEAQEPFKEKQKGSSAMPHKKNPILCERICGLSRVVRGNLISALENISLWHERDISHSSVERIILPDSTIILHYMLYLSRRVIKDLKVFPEKMRENLDKTKGLYFSQ